MQGLVGFSLGSFGGGHGGSPAAVKASP